MTDHGWRVLIRDEAAATGWGTRQPNELLRYYLQRNGWTPDDPGPVGSLWRHGDDAVIAVPDQLTPHMREWNDVLQRLRGSSSDHLLNWPRAWNFSSLM